MGEWKRIKTKLMLGFRLARAAAFLSRAVVRRPTSSKSCCFPFATSGDPGLVDDESEPVEDEDRLEVERRGGVVVAPFSSQPPARILVGDDRW